jgi:hypothetical protein
MLAAIAAVLTVTYIVVPTTTVPFRTFCQCNTAEQQGGQQDQQLTAEC